MKFGELREYARRDYMDSHDEDELVIRVENPQMLGSQPSVPVDSIYAGFDWDKGRIIIHPSEPLVRPERFKLMDLAQRAIVEVICDLGDGLKGRSITSHAKRYINDYLEARK